MSISEKFFSVIVVCGMPMALAAQTNSVGHSVTIANVVDRTPAVVLDGRLDDPVWASVPALPLVMYSPVSGGEMTERSVVKIVHDGSYLYVAGALFDTNPDGIRVNSMYRDVSRADDTFGIILDPFDDNDIGLWFWTTPAGVRGDAEITGDGQGTTNNSWNTYWDVATRRSSEGWFVEMRIPFSSVGFQASDGTVRLGFTIYRYVARKNERQIFPAISQEFNFLRPSLAYDVQLDGVSSRRPAYLTPFVLSGVEQTPVPTSPGDVYRNDNTLEREAGIDMKYNVSDNLTLDLTVNTDFAQVEADDQQVNLTRFALFFPEKRQFFQERSGIFSFTTGGSDRLFHSRRIGLKDGRAVRIYGGARVVGRVGEWDVGMLNMQTAGQAGSAAENFGVARLRRRVLNEHSTLGGILATRLGADGKHNVAYGLDASIRVFGDDYVTVKWAQTMDDQRIDSLGFRFPESGLLRVTWNKARSRGFTYFFSGRWQGADYRPDMGFTTRSNFSDFFYYFAYFHYPHESSALRRIDPFQLFGSVTLRNEDGSVESAFVEHDFDLQWKSGAGLGLDLELFHEDLREPLQFGDDTVVPIGSYTFPRFEGDYSTSTGTPLRASFGWGVQKFYDGWRANVRLGPQWNVSPHLGLNVQYGVDVVRFPTRSQGFDAHLLRVRTQMAANTKVSINGFVQVSNTSDLASANMRFRYNFREGNDLWVVYNHGWNLDRDRQTPSLPRTDRRTLLVKYSHTFTR